ncbi:RNA-directed DNA polymerase [uncultured Draconibacterium sp.]|uniref:RNA-directed DNA polymerase n=1 Tax=uncultured Draconibacterium sp. TaxID=1573823 RepID=UPI00321753D1
MKNILELNEDELKDFFLKEENYINFDLPLYFSFQTLLDKVDNKLSGKKLKGFQNSQPRDFENVNYHLLTNKDGKFAWRPFQIINPAIYVSLINTISEEENWQVIKDRFEIFRENKKIECHSLPIISEEEDRTNKEAQILTWWQEIEQKSILLAIDYRYVLHTDITDCYGSIYTHSISWALHTKTEAKKRANRNNQDLIGVAIDTHLQNMSYGQTNGIPQGSVLMDFIAEIVLGYVDLLLTEKIEELNITEYRILRYRDDYRIFTNNPFEAEQIAKLLSEILSNLGLKLNADKTIASDNIIKSSIKDDKRYWIENKRITENKQKWLIQMHLLSEKFPNSGTLDTQMREFLKSLEKSKRKVQNVEVLISLVTEIAFRNPRVSPIAISILSLLVGSIKEKQDKRKLIRKIQTKFKQVPNSSLLKVWLQRLYLKINKSIEYDELICKKVIDNNEKVWNTEWLNGGLKNIIDKTPIVQEETIKKLRVKASKKEIKKIIKRRRYTYE